MDREEANTSLAEMIARMKSRRQALGLTQAAAAEKMGTVKSNISYWERGKTTPSASALILYADALDWKIQLVDKFPS